MAVTPKQAHELFREHFAKNALRDKYEDKVSASHAVGMDGVRHGPFKAKLNDELSLIIKKVSCGAYRFTRYKQKLISKGATSLPRTLSIPTIRDRVTLRALNDVLTRLFPEAHIKRPHVFIKSVSECLQNPTPDLVFVRMDIQTFFPTISHKVLLKQIKKKVRKVQLLHLLKAALATPTGGSTIAKGVGVPQGLSISNVLSSINLIEIDKKFSADYKYFRYVDDILVICTEGEAHDVFKSIQDEMNAIGLSCHPLGKAGKSQISPVNDGIEYLGFSIKPGRVSVRDSSYRRMFDNLLSVFTEYKHLKRDKNEDRLVWKLNLKITGCRYDGKRYGWLFFFSQTDDKKQLARLDDFVSDQLNKRSLSHLRSKVRKFLKSYHEIRFNLRETSYIPDFDNCDLMQKIDELSKAEGLPREHYQVNFNDEAIEAHFKKLVERQTKMLDQDLIDAFS